jgi:hypothetical protein
MSLLEKVSQAQDAAVLSGACHCRRVRLTVKRSSVHTQNQTGCCFCIDCAKSQPRPRIFADRADPRSQRQRVDM